MSDDGLVDLDDYDDTLHMVCPECGLSGDVPAVWEDLQIECKDCDHRFTVEASGQ